MRLPQADCGNLSQGGNGQVGFAQTIVTVQVQPIAPERLDLVNVTFYIVHRFPRPRGIFIAVPSAETEAIIFLCVQAGSENQLLGSGFPFAVCYALLVCRVQVAPSWTAAKLTPDVTGLIAEGPGEWLNLGKAIQASPGEFCYPVIIG